MSFQNPELKVGQARDIVARAAGLSPTTFQRAVKIIEKGSEKLKEKVRRWCSFEHHRER
jgi:hypothetical protein